MPLSGSYFYPIVNRSQPNITHPGYLSTGLPDGTDDLSGSVVWVTDNKYLAVYGSAGWTEITTGSVVS